VVEIGHRSRIQDLLKALWSSWGGATTAAIGWALGMERLVLLLARFA
jgi:histidyl-tRNA synthetase